MPKLQFLFAFGLIFLIALGVGPAYAQDESDGAETPPGGETSDGGEPLVEEDKEASEDAAPPEVEKKDPPFGNYGKMIKHYEGVLMELPLWGMSSTIPEGFAVVMFGWQTRRPYKRFDQHRKMVDIVPVISVPDPFEKKGKFFELDLGVSGSASGYGGGLIYGLTDTITLSLDAYWAVMHVKIDPIYTPGTADKLGIVTVDDFYEMLEMLGRPRPVEKYDSDPADMGDATFTAKWNNYRGDHVSTGLQGGIIFPTAHQADPQRNLIFALGPELDTGAGTWGTKGGAMIDFKMPDPAGFVTLSFAADAAYFLPDERKAPEFPPLEQDVKDYLASQGIDVEIFPDLSDTGDTYMYTPGPWFATTASLGLGIVSIAYRHGFGGTAKYDSGSEGFKDLVDSIGLVGYGDDGKITVSTNIPLTPLFIPGLVNFNFEYATDGRNAMVFRDVYTVGVGIGIPLALPDKYKFKPEGE